MDSAVPAAAPRTTQRIAYDGRLGDLYRIFLVNLLLSIVTLGIFRFWGKTRMRRYVWSHTTFQGDRFEYTGTGGELFKGFLIVLGFLVLAGLAQGILQMLLGADSPLVIVTQFLFVFAAAYLAMVAQYSAQNYRLTRTLWRGVRGGMTGSAWGYGFKALGVTLLAGLSLGFAWPWASARLINWRGNASWFGSEKLTFGLSAGPLYPTFLLGVVVTPLIGLLAVGAIVGIAQAAGWIDIPGLIDTLSRQPDLAPFGKPEPPPKSTGLAEAETLSIMRVAIAAYVALVLGVGLGYWVGMAPYFATLYRRTAASARFADLAFASHAGAGGLIGLWLGNMLIYLVTLGLGLPILIHRTVRFLADRLEIQGELDGARLTQSTIERPRFGEGLLEAFDPGLF